VAIVCLSTRTLYDRTIGWQDYSSFTVSGRGSYLEINAFEFDTNEVCLDGNLHEEISVTEQRIAK
jgi:hypothetical protein